ncbi:MAG: 1-deoxy-D-xylulose-5-phosphate synthase [Muribaculaceae bacterium]|nr:1-deoxy-D-xylulose-5-phosphate synthase [Muribaculaceae bacterium]
MDLNLIKSPADIKKLDLNELETLADDLRTVLLTKLSKHGGHIGPNLGFLEATVALHYVFDSPKDKIVYDVSHQSYVHKMLTGRMEAFTDPAKYDTVTGYTEPSESEHDFFTIGHTSTSVSLASGLAKARDLKGGKENIIAVIGDGSLSGGEAFEGLDYAATLGTNFIVVVNDNEMSIAENHGGLYADLRLLRNTKGTADVNYFRSLGFAYRYVPYGNDIRSLIKAFQEVKDYPYPVVVHLNTQKGNGFKPAEADRETFHYGGPFDLSTGAPINPYEGEGYDDIFSEHTLKMMKENPLLTVITAGTPGVLGYTPEKRKAAGRQFVDVGIAEQQAVAMASGLAKGGARPVFGVVSSFLQRTYDQLSHDVAINNNPAVVNIFYGTVNGMNDVSHLGWFDIALVSNIPNWVYLAPTCAEEYVAMLDWAVKQTGGPVAIRVPGVAVTHRSGDFDTDYSDTNRYKVDRKGKDVAIIAAGAMYSLGEEVADALAGAGVNATLINPRFLSGLDTELLEDLKADHRVVVTLEDGVLDGGFGQKIASFYGTSDVKVRNYGIAKEFLNRYDARQLLEASHLTSDKLTADIQNMLK